MSEAGEVFNALREKRQARNRNRYLRCVEQAESYPYAILRIGGGQHWRVDIEGEDFDFWPSTGRWNATRRANKVNGKVADFNAFLLAARRARSGE